MRAPSGKTKQFLVATAKLLIVGLAFWFVWNRLAATDETERELFLVRLRENFSAGSILALLILSFFNRFFEILKWHALVSSFRKISVGESTKQVLAALTMSIFTPNGIGEYGAKALFYSKDKAKRIVFLNLICNGVQLLVTVFFGVIGLIIFNLMFDVAGMKVVAAIVALLGIVLIFLYMIRGFTIKGYSLKKLMSRIGEIGASIHRRNAVLAVMRYLVFSHQYLLMFRILGVEIPYIQLMGIIAGMYFLASALPTMQMLDFAVKGGVAVYFFGQAGVNEWIPAFVATAMWILNVALPVLIGSYFVISFKPQWKQSPS